MGYANYLCERIRDPYDDASNYRFVYADYNSQRFCRGQYGFVESANRRGEHSPGTFADGGGGSETLISREFSGRTVQNHCGGRPRPFARQDDRRRTTSAGAYAG